MNPWIALIIGLIVGWIIELLIDVFYWRKRRLCPDDTVLAVRTELEEAKAENGRLHLSLNEDRARLIELESAVATCNSQTDAWRTELNLLDGETEGLGLAPIFADGKLRLGNFVESLRARFERMRSDVELKDVELGNLKADLDAKANLEAEVGDLRGELAARDAKINSLQSDLTAKKNALTDMKGELSGLDNELEGLGLGSMFAGGGLAISGFLANLRDRFKKDEETAVSQTNFEAELGHLHQQIEARDLELNTMRAQLSLKENELGDMHAELNRLQANDSANVDLDTELDALRAELNTRDARLNALQSELQVKEQALGSLQAEVDKLDQEVSGLGLNSLAAGSGGLAVGSFVASLRARFNEGDDGDETAVLNTRIGELEAQLDTCQGSLAELRAQADEYSGPRGLSMVWGLNTQASDTLEKQGIYTYNQLADTTVDEVDEALGYSSKYYPSWDKPQVHNSWVEQSRFAAGGDWEGLFGYQQNSFDVATLKDDLKKLWGVGPKIERVLNDNGIYLFSQVASVPAERITEILRTAGDRFNMSSNKLHESWPTQARLADQEKWDEFKDVTNKLSWTNVHK